MCNLTKVFDCTVLLQYDFFSKMSGCEGFLFCKNASQINESLGNTLILGGAALYSQHEWYDSQGNGTYARSRMCNDGIWVLVVSSTRDTTCIEIMSCTHGQHNLQLARIYLIHQSQSARNTKPLKFDYSCISDNIQLRSIKKEGGMTAY